MTDTEYFRYVLGEHTCLNAKFTRCIFIFLGLKTCNGNQRRNNKTRYFRMKLLHREMGLLHQGWCEIMKHIFKVQALSQKYIQTFKTSLNHFDLLKTSKYLCYYANNMLIIMLIIKNLFHFFLKELFFKISIIDTYL